MHRLLIIIMLSLLPPNIMRGQRVMSWEEFLDYLTNYDAMEIDESGQGAIENEAWVDWMDELEAAHLHPIDINTATPQQLRAIPFLSEYQIEQIIRYTRQHQGMHSLSELILIPSITYRQRQYLPLFLTVDPSPDRTPSLMERTGSRRFKSDLLLRTDIPFYHRRGFLLHNHGKDGYVGSPLYNKLRYHFSTSHIQAGIQTERDPGEKGLDSYGAYLYFHDVAFSNLFHFSQSPSSSINSPFSSSTPTEEVSITSSSTHNPSLWDKLKGEVIVGDFKVRFGQGLILNQGFSIGKSLANIRHTQGLRPNRGTDEVNFMRGAGIALSTPHFTTTFFYSHRRWDATLNSISSNSSASSKSVKTIIRDGYHRTSSELAKKGVLTTDVLGGNLAWNSSGFHVGTTAYYLHTALPLDPGPASYRKIYPRGSQFGALGLDYSYETYRILFFGETAYKPFNAMEKASGNVNIQQYGAWATLNGVSWQPSHRYSLSLLQRYYNHHYHSFFSSALIECGGQVGSVQNETGVTLHMDATPLDGVQMTSYIDLFHNPWPRYGMVSSTSGWDFMTEVGCNISRSNTVKAKYNAKNKQTNSTSSAPLSHRLRLQWLHTSPSEQWNISTNMMLHVTKGSHGEAIGTQGKYKTHDKRCNVSASFLYFHTTSQDSRIYLYETNVSEMTYIPSFSGHGMRMTGMLRYHLFHEHLTLEMKYGLTYYLDRKTQSSNLQTIYSNVKNDITLQARVRL